MNVLEARCPPLPFLQAHLTLLPSPLTLCCSHRSPPSSQSAANPLPHLAPCCAFCLENLLSPAPHLSFLANPHFEPQISLNCMSLGGRGHYQQSPGHPQAESPHYTLFSILLFLQDEGQLASFLSWSMARSLRLLTHSVCVLSSCCVPGTELGLALQQWQWCPPRSHPACL